MFSKSADLYDLVYSWKDYPAEVARIRAVVERRVPNAKTLLDVACGTGRHLELLREWYEIAGVDLDPGLLAIAEQRLGDVPLLAGDMRNFDLGRTFDVVTCLFGSIAYMPTSDDLQRAIANMAGQVAPGGLLIVEPWLTPDRFDPLHISPVMSAEAEGVTVVRMNGHRREGSRAILEMHYLVARPGTVEHLTEEHAISLFSVEQMRASVEAAGLQAEHDPEGLMGRGLWVAQRPT